MSEQESVGTPSEDVYAEGESTGTATAIAPVEESKPLFTDEEIQQFDADDVEVGGAIGKMLAVFFLYTVCAMSHVAYWTFYGNVNTLFIGFTVIVMSIVAWLSFNSGG
jgi:hypothetical protein